MINILFGGTRVSCRLFSFFSTFAVCSALLQHCTGNQTRLNDSICLMWHVLDNRESHTKAWIKYLQGSFAFLPNWHEDGVLNVTGTGVDMLIRHMSLFHHCYFEHVWHFCLATPVTSPNRWQLTQDMNVCVCVCERERERETGRRRLWKHLLWCCNTHLITLILLRMLHERVKWTHWRSRYFWKMAHPFAFRASRIVFCSLFTE